MKEQNSQLMCSASQLRVATPRALLSVQKRVCPKETSQRSCLASSQNLLPTSKAIRWIDLRMDTSKSPVNIGTNQLHTHKPFCKWNSTHHYLYSPSPELKFIPCCHSTSNRWCPRCPHSCATFSSSSNKRALLLC